MPRGSMQLVLLILLPLAVAAGCAVLARERRLIALVGSATALVELLLIWRSPLETPGRVLGETLLLPAAGQLILVVMLLAAAAAMLADLVRPAAVAVVPIGLIMLGLVIASVLAQSAILASLLLLAAGLACVPLVLADQPVSSRPASRAARRTLQPLPAIVLGGALLMTGLILRDAALDAPEQTADLLLVLGVGTWLAAALWYPAAAAYRRSAFGSPMGIVLGVFGPASVSLVLKLFQ